MSRGPGCHTHGTPDLTKLPCGPEGHPLGQPHGSPDVEEEGPPQALIKPQADWPVSPRAEESEPRTLRQWEAAGSRLQQAAAAGRAPECHSGRGQMRQREVRKADLADTSGLPAVTAGTSEAEDGRALLCFSLCPRPEVVFLQGPGLWDQSHLRASLYLNPEPLPEVPGFKHQHTNLGDTVQPAAETRMEPRSQLGHTGPTLSSSEAPDLLDEGTLTLPHPMPGATLILPRADVREKLLRPRVPRPPPLEAPTLRVQTTWHHSCPTEEALRDA
ncbi:hypothetical protein JEQ12_007014 [Ovis aries]|uniref:Uncharacterized protein n=1 Tax=Ovis aries TaxID=9940 RepID=A0A836CVQ2_SHEEP|nr:hypothetical protein JEQ12_007014 [Ovis aries]